MSTPIRNLPEDPNQTLDEDQAVVQTILQEIKQQESPPPHESPQYVGEPHPRTQPHDSIPPRDFQYYEDVDQGVYQEPPAQDNRQWNQTSTQISKDLSSGSSKSLWQKIWQEAKQPLIVLALFVLFSLRGVDKIIMRYVPRMANDVGYLNFFGLLAKSILITIVFFLLKKIIK